MSDKITKLSIITEDKTQTENELFNAEDHYIIPIYQRAFSWEETQIRQLMYDIDSVEENHYFLGSLIVYKKESPFKKGEPLYEVIDGQQRLTILMLLLSTLYLEKKEKWSDKIFFECREKSNLTLKKWLNNDYSLSDLNSEPFIDKSIEEGLNIISKLLQNFDVHHLKKQLKKVRIFRIEVPQHTDLNRYFEIMNI